MVAAYLVQIREQFIALRKTNLLTVHDNVLIAQGYVSGGDAFNMFWFWS